MRPNPLSIVGALAAASIARAQQFSVTSDSTITWSVNWTESPGGNNDGRIEPGESAVIHLSAAFSNQNGIANFSPPIGGFGSGTIRGLGGGLLALHGTGGAEGQWNLDPNSGYGVAALWHEIGEGPFSYNGGVDITPIAIGQFPFSVGSVMTTNPVLNIFLGLWTPSDYTPRTVTWHSVCDPVECALVVQVGSMVPWVFVDPSNVFFGSVQIPVGVPAPSAALVLASLVAAPRRRRSR